MLDAGYDADAYHVFVVRLWRERAASPQHPSVWRFLVEDTRTGQRRGFGSLEELATYLQVRMEESERGAFEV